MNKIKTIIIVFLLTNSTIFSQTLVNFGSLTNFILFTSAGAVANTGACNITGDIGTAFGAVTLATVAHNGNTHIQNPAAAQANLDLVSLYIQLMCIPNTNLDHSPTFGAGETITANIYTINGSGFLAADLTLDAQGDSNAVFVLKFNGEFTTNPSSSINLINGTRACNIFWIAEGAVSIGTSTMMVGTVISHFGAVTMASNGTLTGRLFSLKGAITFASLVGQKPICNTDAVTPYPANCAISPFTPDCYSISSGSCAAFNLFTSNGAIANTSSSTITGKIGTNSIDTITGFNTSTVNGIIHITDSVTAKAKIDLDIFYSQLLAVPTTNSEHAPAFGGNETLYPGIYHVAGAGSIAGNLILDGLGDTNAVFIFKIGAAFTTGALASISLINDVSSCNVFWITEQGAINIGAGSSLKGTFIVNNGAINIEANAIIEGRLFSTTGAIALDGITSFTFTDCDCIPPYPLPINLLDFSGECLPNQIRLNWETASETNNDYFSIERSKDGINWSEIGKISGTGNSSSSRKYFLDDKNWYNEISYYQLKQHDFSGVSRTYNPISVKNCFNGNEVLSIYPNPATNEIKINFNGNIEQVINTSIVDLFGRIMHESSAYQSAINTENFEEGIYFLQLLLKSGNITRKFLISK